MKPKDTFRALIIPKKINKTCSDLSHFARHIYCLLGSLSKKNGTCFPSHNYIADYLGISKRAVINRINELVEKGYISKQVHSSPEERKWNSSNTYTIKKRWIIEYYNEFSNEEKNTDKPSESQTPDKMSPQLDKSHTPQEENQGDRGVNVVHPPGKPELPNNGDGECSRFTPRVNLDHSEIKVYNKYNTFSDNSFINKTINETSFRSRMGSKNPHQNDHLLLNKKHRPETKEIKLPFAVKEILDFYYEDYYIKKCPAEGTKQYTKDVERIKMALNGSLFKGHSGFEDHVRKYSVDEIKLAISRYALQFDPEYYPANKNNLSIYLERFLFCPYSKVNQSSFIKCLHSEPKKKPGQPVAGNRGKPEILAEILKHIEKPKTQPEMDKLIMASYAIYAFFKDPKKDRYWNRGIFHFSYKEMAEIFYNAIKEDVNGTMRITPGFFLSNKTLKERVPTYLDKCGFILQYKWD